MKVILVYHRFFPCVGGIENLMLGMGQALTRRGHEITVLTSNVIKYEPGRLKFDENVQGIHVKRFKPLRFLPSAFVTVGVVPYLLSTTFDVMHVFSYHPVFMTNASSIVSKLLRKPLVMTPIYNPIRTTLSERFGLARFFDYKIGPTVLKKADCVTALTSSEAHFYTARGVKNAVVIPEGVYTNNAPPATEVQRFKEKYLLSGEIVLSVGRITESKGFDLLIKAFAPALQDFPRAKLLVVGEDWGYLSSLKKIALELGCDKNIVFAGLVDDLELACAYEAADIVVHPARFETFVRIALEAWVHRKPIVCFDLGGPTEFISSETGILVKYCDVSEMSQAIIRLLSDAELRMSMGEEGHRLVGSKYSWDSIATQIENIYRFVSRG